MTYGAICKTIKAHRGRVYACINAVGCQYHIEAKKGEMYDTFYNYGLTYGMDNETDLCVEVRHGELFLDTEVAQ